MAIQKGLRCESEALQHLRIALERESNDGRALLRDIADNPICSVSCDATVPCLQIVWKRYATSNQLRFIHETIIHLLKKHGMNAVIGDDRALPTIHSDDQAWIVDDWLPRAVRAGLRAAASITPASHFGRISVEQVKAKLASCIEVRSFDGIADARDWIQGLALAT